MKNKGRILLLCAIVLVLVAAAILAMVLLPRDQELPQVMFPERAQEEETVPEATDSVEGGEEKEPSPVLEELSQHPENERPTATPAGAGSDQSEADTETSFGGNNPTVKATATPKPEATDAPIIATDAPKATDTPAPATATPGTTPTAEPEGDDSGKPTAKPGGSDWSSYH
ncbi:MAG: hypothetical protein IJR17_00915 [Clostridia bacterium]|nr:hypothetical protein [Clostridia bacterium]